MKRQIAILLAIYVSIEVVYTLLGDPFNKIWSAFYCVNQSFLIIGSLFLFKNYTSNILIEIAIALNVVKCLFNILTIAKPEFAAVINLNYYVGLVIVCFILFALILKQLHNYDGKR
jgi:hypothetical protein